MAQQEATSRLFLGNLDPSVTEQQLEAELLRFSRPTSVWVARNPPGFSFVEFATIPDAEACLVNVNGMRIGKNDVRVEFAKNRGRKEAPVSPAPAPV
jgi:RNA recognition motif-containing protein